MSGPRERPLRVVLANRAVWPVHPPSGLEKYVYYLGCALQEEGAEVEVVCAGYPGAGSPSPNGAVPITVLAPSAPWDRPFAPGLALRQMAFGLNPARHLARRRPDVVHAFNTVAYAYVALPRRAVVLLHALEEVVTAGLEEEEKGALPWVRRPALHAKRWLDRWLFARADAVLVGTQEVAPLYIRAVGVRPRRVLTLQDGGVHLKEVQERQGQARLSREDLGLSPEDFVLVSTNRMVPLKGLPDLLEAFARVLRDLPTAVLLLVGTGPQEPELRAQAQRLGLGQRVRFLGRVEEERLYALYRLCDLYVSPTLHLTLSQSALEAMACGLPLVSTDYLAVDGVNGYRVPKRDPEAMARAILRVHREGRLREMGEASRRLAREYDFRAIARRALGHYRALLEERATR